MEKKVTAVEWLCEQIKIKADNVPTNTKENRMAKGVYVDCLIMAKQAKEMEEKQQGYSEEEVKEILLDFRCDFNGGEITSIDSWFKQFKNK